MSRLNVKSFVKRNGEKVKDADGQFIMRDDFYFKSLMFLYFKNQQTPVQWEKKTIKEEFFPTTKRNQEGRFIYRGLNDQQTARRASNDLPLYFPSNDKFLIRDLLGLSSEEQWQSYKDSIKKKEAEKDRHGNWVSKKEGDSNSIQRFASPIFFKPIVSGNTATIYIRLDKLIQV